MAKLTIEHIAIENLGPFRERQLFDLSVHAERPVILVKALNGSGKTTLLTALQVGLYGYKAINPARRSEYDQLISGLQRKDATGPSRVEMALNVEVGAQKQSLLLRREWAADGKGYREHFKVTSDTGDSQVLSEEWDDFINDILPVELVHLFLFDGEKIEALASPERLPALLRRATEVFLGLGGIDALSNDLKALERRAGGKKNLTTEATEVQKLIAGYEHQMVALGVKIQLLAQRQADARNQVDEAQKKLEAFSLEAQRSGLQAYEQAGALQGRLELCKEQHQQARSMLVAALEDPILPLAWLGPLWNDYQAQWDKDKQAKHAALLAEEIAKRDERVLTLLKEREPKATSAVAAILADERKELEQARQHEPIFLDGGDPVEIGPLLAQAKARLKQAQDAVSAAEAALEKAQQAVDHIPAKEQLAGVFEAMQKHSQAVAAAETALRDIGRELDEAKTSEQHVETRLNSAAARLQAELKENTFLLYSFKAGERARKTLMVFRERLLASKAEWLSEMITIEFKQLLRKRNLISRVHVEPQTYSVSIEDTNGHTLPMERLSAGERQILAIAVLSALIRERKGRFPVVVDTPLARLDRKHREALIHHFFAKVSHQVLVLSTDEEVEGSVHRALEQHLSREYALTFDDAIRSSIVMVKTYQLQLEDGL